MKMVTATIFRIPGRSTLAATCTPALLALLLALPTAARAQEAPAPAPAADATAAAPAPAAPEAAPDPAAQVVPPTLATFREAVLPADLGVPPGQYVVTLVLTVDEAGAVTEVQTAASDDPRLAPLAVDAAGKFVFTPATVQGQPVAVQITYRYAFDIRPKERQVVHVFRVVEKGSRNPPPVDGVTGILEENGRSFTAFQGRMEISDVPAGKYTLYVPTGEFAELRRPFTVAEGRVQEEEIRLERRYGDSNQTVIRAPKEVRFVARQTLEATELRRLPGSGGDPLKMVENLPGIARSSFGSGQLVVFGSPPFDTQVLIEGLPFVMLYHFGGVYSTINPEFIQRIDFVPAGFDASYGRASAGIVNVKIKEDPLTALHGNLDMNLLHTGLYLGLPYSDDGDFQFAFRRSYLDAFLSFFSFGDAGLQTAPRYYDYQGRVRHKVGRHQFIAFVYGTDDALVVVNKKANSQEPTFVGTVSLAMAGHSLQLRWTYDGGPTFKNALSAQIGVTQFDFNLFNSIKLNTTSLPVYVREEADWKVHPKVGLRLGADLWVQPSWYDIRSPAPARQGAVAVPLGAQEFIVTKGTQMIGSVAPYLSVEWKPFDWWTIVPSIRADVYMGDWKGWSVDPRLASRFEILKDRLSLRVAGGLFQQPPPNFTYLPELGNPKLKSEAAAHALLGIEYQPLDRLTISADGFFKWLFNRAEPSDDRTKRYTNDGEGRAYGFDVLVRMNPGGRFFGWIAYTFVRSQIWDRTAKAWRFSDYDQTHLLNILASYELPKHWTIGGRFRLTSGFPYTPVERSVYDADLDRYIGVPSQKINSKRLPLFHQLDLRVDKQWVYENYKVGLYLEIQNVYNQKNAEALLYNYDLTRTAYVSGTTLLPVLGLKIDW